MRISTKLRNTLNTIVECFRPIEQYIYFLMYVVGTLFIVAVQPSNKDKVKASFLFAGIPAICKICRAISKLKTYDEFVSDYNGDSEDDDSYEVDDSEVSNDEPLVTEDELTKPLVEFD